MSAWKARQMESRLSVDDAEQFLRATQAVDGPDRVQECVEIGLILQDAVYRPNYDNPATPALLGFKARIDKRTSTCRRRLTEFRPSDPNNWVEYSRAAALSSQEAADTSLKQTLASESQQAARKAVEIAPKNVSALENLFELNFYSLTLDERITWQRRIIAALPRLDRGHQLSLLSLVKKKGNSEDYDKEAAVLWGLIRNCNELLSGPAPSREVGEAAGPAVSRNEQSNKGKEAQRIRTLIKTCDTGRVSKGEKINFYKSFAEAVQHKWRSMPPPYDIKDEQFRENEYQPNLSLKIHELVETQRPASNPTR